MNKTVYMNNGPFGLRTTTIGADRSECDILMSLNNFSVDLIFLNSSQIWLCYWTFKSKYTLSLKFIFHGSLKLFEFESKMKT